MSTCSQFLNQDKYLTQVLFEMREIQGMYLQPKIMIAEIVDHLRENLLAEFVPSRK